MKSHFEKDVVLITGCSKGGIGHALAREFASKNCVVVATSRSLASMAGLDGDDPSFFLQELDVLSDESVRKVVFNVIEKFGRIDILVNNAGIAYGMPIAEMPLSGLHRVMDTNVYGAVRLVQAVFPHMATRRKGKIVNVGSVVVMAPGPWIGAYIASKAALHALTDTLRLELGPFGINVTTVVPGAILTNIANNVIANYSQQLIPELKLYKPFQEAILKSADAAVPVDDSTPAEDFAEKTVAAVLKKNPPAWFTYGRYSTFSAIMYYLPLCIKDYFLKKYM